jgi:hypothetical protein
VSVLVLGTYVWDAGAAGVAWVQVAEADHEKGIERQEQIDELREALTRSIEQNVEARERQEDEDIRLREACRLGGISDAYCCEIRRWEHPQCPE